MNLKPYKNLVPEHQHIKYPFLERNFAIFGWLAALVGIGLAVYYTLQ